jgi:hypothetical protein
MDTEARNRRMVEKIRHSIGNCTRHVVPEEDDHLSNAKRILAGVNKLHNYSI